MDSLSVYFNPRVNSVPETHLEYCVFYATHAKGNRWNSGTLSWGHYEDAESLINDVLKYQTDFVKSRWVRIEVCIPNRDEYGNLRPGLVKDIGLLLATRSLSELKATK